jgi:hypothetical protein
MTQAAVKPSNLSITVTSLNVGLHPISKSSASAGREQLTRVAHYMIPDTEVKYGSTKPFFESVVLSSSQRSAALGAQMGCSFMCLHLIRPTQLHPDWVSLFDTQYKP